MSSNAPIPDVAQVLVNWTIHDVLTQNALFFHHWPGPIIQADLDLLRDRVAFTFRNNFLQALGAGVVLRSVECKDRTTGSSLTSSVTLDRHPFTLEPAAPSSIALALIQYIGSVYEVHPSRAFVAGIRANQISGNMIDSSAAASLVALWSTNNASHGPFGWHHVRVSLFAGGVPRTVGVFAQINGYGVKTTRVSEQRRREQPAI